MCILNLIATLGIALQTAKNPQAESKPPSAIFLPWERPAPNFDIDIMVPLREKQAEEAAAVVAAERARIAAELAKTRDRVKAPFTYSSAYFFGNCTWYVAGRIQVPDNWGNANTWFWSAQASGWQTGFEPRIGAIATTTGGWFGHVAIVEAVDNSGNVQVSEMNVMGFDIISRRWTAASDFAYIY